MAISVHNLLKTMKNLSRRFYQLLLLVVINLVLVKPTLAAKTFIPKRRRV